MPVRWPSRAGGASASEAPGDNAGAAAPDDVAVAFEADAIVEPSDVEVADGELVDGFAVLAEVTTLEPGTVTTLPTGPLPAVQAVAVAATGFVAGAATVALVHRLGARKVARTQANRQGRGLDGLPVVASHRFLVDVHLIAKPQE